MSELAGSRHVSGELSEFRKEMKKTQIMVRTVELKSKIIETQ